MELNNNKILLTGATGGIGKALTTEFLKYRNNIIIAVGRDEKKLNDLRIISGKVIPFKCDLTDPLQREELVLFVEQDHSDLNILMNNAGIQYHYHFQEEQHITNKIKLELDINLYAPLSLIGMLLPVLSQNAQSAIVNISSALALSPKKQAPVYCGSKAALHIFSKSLRYQLEETDIQVFDVFPPLVDTDMTKGRGRGKISPEEFSREFILKFKKNQYEMAVGKVKWLKLIRRLSPALADRMLKNGNEITHQY